MHNATFADFLKSVPGAPLSKTYYLTAIKANFTGIDYANIVCRGLI
jgi:hypothetical protein